MKQLPLFEQVEITQTKRRHKYRNIRDPWDRYVNPHLQLGTAIRVIMLDAPPDVVRSWTAWQRDITDLVTYLKPEEIEKIKAEIQKYKDEPTCERCFKPEEKRFLYNGRQYCGSCRGELAARSRWGWDRSKN